jgi:hypothetical protein
MTALVGFIQMDISFDSALNHGLDADGEKLVDQFEVSRSTL